MLCKIYQSNFHLNFASDVDIIHSTNYLPKTEVLLLKTRAQTVLLPSHGMDTKGVDYIEISYLTSPASSIVTLTNNHGGTR